MVSNENNKHLNGMELNFKLVEGEVFLRTTEIEAELFDLKRQLFFDSGGYSLRRIGDQTDDMQYKINAIWDDSMHIRSTIDFVHESVHEIQFR